MPTDRKYFSHSNTKLFTSSEKKLPKEDATRIKWLSSIRKADRQINVPWFFLVLAITSRTLIYQNFTPRESTRRAINCLLRKVAGITITWVLPVAVDLSFDGSLTGHMRHFGYEA